MLPDENDGQRDEVEPDINEELLNNLL